LLSEVRFGSFLVYSPRGTSETSRRSRRICHAIKTDGVFGQPPMRIIEYAVGRLKEAVGTRELGDLLAPDVTLVPCPRSAPFPPGQRPALWVPLRICTALRAGGLGATIMPLLERVEAVRKSAFAGPGERPSVQSHVATMRVDQSIERPARVTIIDDVVTKGATLLAAASLLADAFPAAEVRAFALVRTMGLVPEVDRIVDPVTGRIAWTQTGGADRQP
jgi:hypothetical protein